MFKLTHFSFLQCVFNGYITDVRLNKEHSGQLIQSITANSFEFYLGQ